MEHGFAYFRVFQVANIYQRRERKIVTHPSPCSNKRGFPEREFPFQSHCNVGNRNKPSRYLDVNKQRSKRHKACNQQYTG